MYVSAPYLGTNGSIQVQSTLGIRLSGSGSSNRFPTPAAAKAQAGKWTHQPGYRRGRTGKSFLTNGRTGPDSFANTPYRASYHGVKAFGTIDTLTRYTGGSGTEHGLEQVALGFHVSGSPQSSFALDDPTGVVDQFGGDLINRAIILNQQNRAQAECKNKLSRMELDLAESLVGLPATIEMIAHSVLNVLTAWKAVRSGNIRRAQRILGRPANSKPHKTLAKAWLSLEYGWKPLLNDIFDGVKAVEELLAQPKPHAIAVRRLSCGLVVPHQLRANTMAFFPGVVATASGECSVEVKMRGRVHDSTLFTLSSLQLLNPLYIGWVAMPFSFVVDWLLPVGDWLSSITAPLGLTFTDGYMTTLTSAHAGAFAQKASITGNGQVVVEQWGATSAVVEYGQMSRHVFTNWSWPTPYFRLPSTQPQRIASAVALTIETSRLR